MMLILRDPDDGIFAAGVVPDLVLIPWFWEVTGYSRQILDLRRELRLGQGQLRSFAYDWRLSCRLNGRIFAEFLDREVEAWRKRSGDGEAQAVVVAHSMGGLVARWAIEVENAGGLVSQLVTFGTPYRGAAKALDALVNGLRVPRLVRAPFDELVRSLPAVRELLPTYKCVRPHGGPAGLLTVSEAGVLKPAWVAEAARFHNGLASAVAAGGAAVVSPVVGSRQPTVTSAAMQSDGSLQLFETTDGTDRGPDYGGDGTVPSDSATPPEWTSDQAKSAASAVAQDSRIDSLRRCSDRNSLI